MNRIRIDERLKQLRRDELSDHDIAEHVVNAVVDTPIRDILVNQASIADLGRHLGITAEDAADLTYGQAAVRIHDMVTSGDVEEKDSAYSAMYLLSRPFKVEKNRRKKREENKPQ